MRISLMGWRRSTLGIVTAVACASGLQITGCVRSSSHNVSADISRRAAASALKAERAIASKNSRRSLFDTKSIFDTGKVAKQRKATNPFADLLAARSERYPGGDPFIESDTPQDSSKQAQPKTSDDSRQNIQLTQHEQAQSRSQDGSAIARPIPEGSLQNSKLTEEIAGTTKFDWARGPHRRDAQTQQNDTYSKNAVVENTADEEAPGVAKLPPSTQDFKSNDIGSWQQLDDEVILPRKSLVAEKASSESPENFGDNQLAQRQRVKALIKQSKLQHGRGELHAAYRSALLADRLVDQFGITLTAHDVNPSTVAKEISAQIWGSSKKKESLATKAVESRQLPIIRPRRRRSVQHDRVFQTPDTFLNWQSSVGEQQENSLTNHAEKTSSRLIVNTRPKTEPAAEVDSAIFSNSAESIAAQMGILQTSGIDPFNASEHDWTSAEAALLPELKVPQRQEVTPAPERAQQMPEGFSSADSVELDLLNESPPERLPLFAPIQEVNPFSVNLEAGEAKQASEFTPASAGQLAEASPVEVHPQRQLLWGVVAFILATLSALIGLKLSRSTAGQTLVKEETPEEKTSEEQGDSHLQISKAA